ncbi:MAG: ester cyclase [Gaiellales bacterium]
MVDADQLATYWVAAFNSHDRDRIAVANAHDIRMVVPPDLELHGRDEATDHVVAWLAAFPDARIEVETQFAADDRAVQEFTFRGTHAAPLRLPTGDIPATGRTVTRRGVQLIRAERGRVAELQLYFDQVQLLTQLGLIREPVIA